MIMLAIFAIFISGLFAQSNSYLVAKSIVIEKGYTIVEEKSAYIVEGNYLYSTRFFYQGLEYVIYADSDDSDVQDIDIYTYYSDGDGRDKDTTTDKNAVVVFTPMADITLKIVVKNYRSIDSINLSQCRYFVAYK